MALFMEKPSKKQYPDYYDIIQHPIDMITIRLNIENDKYGTLDDVVGDFRLMFANCRKYNEEGSRIYEGAGFFFLSPRNYTVIQILNSRISFFSSFNIIDQMQTFWNEH